MSNKHLKLATGIIVLLLLQYGVYSQNPFDTTKSFLHGKPYNDVVKINGMAMILGYVPISTEYFGSVEIRTRDYQSLVFGAGMFVKNWTLWFEPDTGFSYKDFHVDGYRVSVSYRFYLSKEDRQPTGIYLAPVFNLGQAKYDWGPTSPRLNYIQINRYDISLLGGIQFLLGPVGLDMYGGLGYSEKVWRHYKSSSSFVYIDDPTVITKTPFDNIKITIGINACIAF